MSSRDLNAAGITDPAMRESYEMLLLVAIVDACGVNGSSLQVSLLSMVLACVLACLLAVGVGLLAIAGGVLGCLLLYLTG